MAMGSCKGICGRYKANIQRGTAGQPIYGSGIVRCSTCGERDGIYLKWDGLNCPCCGMRVRVSARKDFNGAKTKVKAILNTKQ